VERIEIERAFYHYQKWEDWQNGMYRLAECDPSHIAKSVALLGNAGDFEHAAAAVFVAWPIATEVNLTNRSANRRAWLGRASCCLHHGASECVTRPAWFLLTQQQQDEANAVADRLIEEWELNYAEAQTRNGRFNRRKRAHRLDARTVPTSLRQLQWW